MPPRKKPEPIPTWGWWTIGSFLGVIILAFLIASGILAKLFNAVVLVVASLAAGGLGLGLIALVACLYFIPALLARRSPRVSAIFVANLVFGWTIVGWFIILIWALAEAGSMNNKQAR